MIFAWAAFWVALVFGLIARELSFRGATVLAGLWMAGLAAMVCFGAFGHIGTSAPAGAAFGFGLAFLARR